MPELPEVQTTVNSLKEMLNLTIKQVYFSNLPLRKPVNFLNTDVLNLTIIKIERIAKYIVIYLSNNSYFLVHLGMSGRLILTNTLTTNKHNHVIINFNNKYLIFNDPRRFGLFLHYTANINSNTIISKYAIDPLNVNFNGQYLFNKLKHYKTSIKTALLNQTIVSGIGNIYASEILFYSNINPTTPCNLLSIKNCHILAEYCTKILTQAIAAGGTTLKDYTNALGIKGDFQNNCAAYGKQNTLCQICLLNNINSYIIKIVQNQRATFYCPSHQC